MFNSLNFKVYISFININFKISILNFNCIIQVYVQNFNKNKMQIIINHDFFCKTLNSLYNILTSMFTHEIIEIIRTRLLLIF